METQIIKVKELKSEVMSGLRGHPVFLFTKVSDTPPAPLPQIVPVPLRDERRATQPARKNWLEITKVNNFSISVAQFNT